MDMQLCQPQQLIEMLEQEEYQDLISDLQGTSQSRQSHCLLDSFLPTMIISCVRESPLMSVDSDSKLNSELSMHSQTLFWVILTEEFGEFPLDYLANTVLPDLACHVHLVFYFKC
jgi:hypothetical protein